MNVKHFLFVRLTDISRSFIPENRRHLKNRAYVTLVAKFLVLNKPWFRKYGRKDEKIDMHDFPVTIALRNKTLGQTFFPSFDNANCRLFQERFPTMETLMSPLYGYNFLEN